VTANEHQDQLETQKNIVNKLKEENKTQTVRGNALQIEKESYKRETEKFYSDIVTNLRNVNRTQKDSQEQISSLLKEKTFQSEFSKIIDQFKRKISHNIQEVLPDLACSDNVNQTQTTTMGGKVLKPFPLKKLIVLFSMSLFILIRTKMKPD
jgi:hypothetical protein